MPEPTATSETSAASAACHPSGACADSPALPVPPPPRDPRSRRLHQSAADGLGAPWLRCLRRACRRKGRCGIWDRTVEEPVCIRNMSPDECRLFFELIEIAEAFDKILQTGTLADWCRNREDRRTDRLQLAGLEIIDRLAPGDPQRLAEFRNFWRAEVKMRVASRTGTHSGNDTAP